jgi:capsular polysaccharide biosynthesis protein
VAKTVIRQQDLQMTTEEFLGEHLSVEQVPNIQWIEVHYRDVSPERAQRVADAVGDVFSEQVFRGERERQRHNRHGMGAGGCAR